MSIQRVLSFFRSPLGRVGTALVGLSAVGLLFAHAGAHAVLAVLFRTARFFPWVLLLEGGILACTTCALRTLYGKERRQIPAGTWFRAGAMGYAVMGLVPAGRAVAEAARAALLSRYVPASRATAAAVQLQGVALLANAAISIPAALALFSALGISLPVILIGLNFGAAGVAGAGILLAGRSSLIGKWLGRALPSVREFGREFDRHLLEKNGLLLGALGWEFLGRVLQVLQNGVLVLAVGGSFGALSALRSEGLHLVGAAAGDLIPAQLGATELSYQFSAKALALHPVDALSIALLAHTAQLVWIGVGALVPIFRSRPRETGVSSLNSVI